MSLFTTELNGCLCVAPLVPMVLPVRTVRRARSAPLALPVRTVSLVRLARRAIRASKALPVRRVTRAMPVQVSALSAL